MSRSNSDRCPPAELLSAYVDGELEQRWSGRIESHLRDCKRCAGIVAGLWEIRSRLHQEADIDFVDAMVRVRNSLASPLVEREVFHGRRPLWRRTVSVPLAVTAAFALLVMGLALVWGITRYRGSVIRITAAPTGLVQVEIEGRNPADVQALLDALNKGNRARIVTFEIPQDYRLVPFGEPRLRPAGEKEPRW